MINDVKQVRAGILQYFENNILDTEKILALAPPGEFGILFSEYLANLLLTFFDSDFYNSLSPKYQPYSLVEMMDIAVQRIKSRVFFYIDEKFILTGAPPVMVTDLLSQDEYNYITDLDEKIPLPEKQPKPYRDIFLSPDVNDEEED